MIFPTPLAVGLAAAGGPIALLIGAFAPSLWLLGLLWVVLIAGLILADAAIGANRRELSVDLSAAGHAYVGASLKASLRLQFQRGPAPGRIDIRFETNALLRPLENLWRVRPAGRIAVAETPCETTRRGMGEIISIWVEWRGPLGLVTKRRVFAIGQAIEIVANILSVREEALRLFARDTTIGDKTHIHSGGGSEFEALRDFLTGMDRRTIDWKQSARHNRLLAKEFRTEQDQTIVFAVDTGRLMCEPIERIPKIDHAINAALLLAYVSLKMGDRVGVFGFDAKPNVSTAPVSGVSAFNLLQKLTARLDYSTEETNFTLGLSQLSADVERRSLIVIFTDFADPTSAELMLENVGRLVRKHLVLFVAIRDEELDVITSAQPRHVVDATRAVVAHTLINEREIVLSRLQRLGVEMIDAPVSRLGPALLNRYLDLKRASRI